MDNFLSGLKLDYWCKVFVLLGAIGIIASATIDLHGIRNEHALLLSLGIFLIGTGEWINHPFQTYLVPPQPGLPMYGQVTGHPRRNKAHGVAFVVVGILLSAIAVYKIIRVSNEVQGILHVTWLSVGSLNHL